MVIQGVIRQLPIDPRPMPLNLMKQGGNLSLAKRGISLKSRWVGMARSPAPPVSLSPPFLNARRLLIYLHVLRRSDFFWKAEASEAVRATSRVRRPSIVRVNTNDAGPT